MTLQVHNYYHPWIFDEFNEPSSDSAYAGATKAGTTFSNAWLRAIDGQQLERKYGTMFHKTVNVPIVLIVAA